MHSLKLLIAFNCFLRGKIFPTNIPIIIHPDLSNLCIVLKSNLIKLAVCVGNLPKSGVIFISIFVPILESANYSSYAKS
jgi:hypothetical protein